MSYLDRLSAPAARLDGWLGRQQTRLLLAATAAYLLATGLIASHKLLWFDELFTMHLSRLPNLSAIWESLTVATDLNPPLMYLITRAVEAVCGTSELAVRLPAIVGFWAMCLGVYFYVGRRLGPTWGWIALLVPVATWAYPYAFEARPYGIVMGCCGVSLICWQLAGEGRRRALVLVGIAASLAVAVSCHYYAVLLFIPLGLGEVTRTVVRRRVDPGVWLALFAGLAPLAWYLPLIEAARNYSTTHQEQAGPSFIHDFYYQLLGRMTLPLLSLLFVLAVAPVWSAAPAGEPVGSQNLGRNGVRMSADELVFALALLALPVFGVALSKLGSGAFGMRYALSAVAGFALVLPVVLFRVSRGSPAFGLGFLALLAGWVALVPVGEYRRVSDERARRLETLNYLAETTGGDGPVVISSPIYYVQMLQYATPELRARLRYVCAPDTEPAYFERRQYSIEGALVALSRVRDIQMQKYHSFVEGHEQFLVYGFGKATSAMEADGVRFEVTNLRGANFCLKAQQPSGLTQSVRSMPAADAAD